MIIKVITAGCYFSAQCQVAEGFDPETIIDCRMCLHEGTVEYVLDIVWFLPCLAQWPVPQSIDLEYDRSVITKDANQKSELAGWTSQGIDWSGRIDPTNIEIFFKIGLVSH